MFQTQNMKWTEYKTTGHGKYYNIVLVNFSLFKMGELVLSPGQLLACETVDPVQSEIKFFPKFSNS